MDTDLNSKVMKYMVFLFENSGFKQIGLSSPNQKSNSINKIKSTEDLNLQEQTVTTHTNRHLDIKISYPGPHNYSKPRINTSDMIKNNSYRPSKEGKYKCIQFYKIHSINYYK